MALTQPQLLAAVADRAELPKADIKRVLDALEEIVQDELGNAQKVRIGGLVQLTVRVKPAQKKRQGRNPATGEEITIAAKPASVDVRARPLAKAKGGAALGPEGAPPARRLRTSSSPASYRRRAAKVSAVAAPDHCCSSGASPSQTRSELSRPKRLTRPRWSRRGQCGCARFFRRSRLAGSRSVWLSAHAGSG